MCDVVEALSLRALHGCVHRGSCCGSLQHVAVGAIRDHPQSYKRNAEEGVPRNASWQHPVLLHLEAPAGGPMAGVSQLCAVMDSTEMKPL